MSPLFRLKRYRCSTYTSTKQGLARLVWQRDSCSPAAAIDCCHWTHVTGSHAFLPNMLRFNIRGCDFSYSSHPCRYQEASKTSTKFCRGTCVDLAESSSCYRECAARVPSSVKVAIKSPQLSHDFVIVRNACHSRLNCQNLNTYFVPCEVTLRPAFKEQA